MKTKTVVILGLDRISASIGKAVRKSGLDLTVIGYDPEKTSVDAAIDIGAIDKGTPNLNKGASIGDILIMNISLEKQEEALMTIGAGIKEHTLIVDIGGLKGSGQNWASKYLNQGHYVGASPVLSVDKLMDGRQSIRLANEDLFENSVLCLMPSPRADPKAVETAVNLGRIIGATPFFLDAFEFDSLRQGIETVPGLLSAASFRAITQRAGWRDVLRFAGQPFAMVTSGLDNQDLVQMALHDSLATIRLLDSVIEELSQIRRLLAEGDEERFRVVMENMELEREKWLHERQRNQWTDSSDAPDLGGINIATQLFGFRPKRNNKKQ